MKTLIVYSSRYGQTEKIAKRLAQTIQTSGESVEFADAKQSLNLKSIQAFDRIILGSPIYTSSHSKHIQKFIKRFRDELDKKQTAFFSGSASAAGDESQRNDATNCMNQFLAKCDFEPRQKTIFAGAIPYTKYNWFIRMLMKWITGKAGGDTDTSKDYEYTNWDRVEEFSLTILLSDENAAEAA